MTIGKGSTIVTVVSVVHKLVSFKAIVYVPAEIFTNAELAENPPPLIENVNGCAGLFIPFAIIDVVSKLQDKEVKLTIILGVGTSPTFIIVEFEQPFASIATSVYAPALSPVNTPVELL